MRTVRSNRNGTRLLAIFHTGWITQRQARLIESVELFEDQHDQRLAQIKRRFPHGAEEIARIERRHANASAGQVRGGYHARRRESAIQTREIDAGEDMRRIRRADEQCVRRIHRPAGKVCRAKIGSVELGPGDFGRAIDASTAGCGGRIPALAARQGLTRIERRTVGKGRARKAKRDAAGRCQLDELAARNTHACYLFA